MIPPGTVFQFHVRTSIGAVLGLNGREIRTPFEPEKDHPESKKSNDRSSTNSTQKPHSSEKRSSKDKSSKKTAKVKVNNELRYSLDTARDSRSYVKEDVYIVIIHVDNADDFPKNSRLQKPYGIVTSTLAPLISFFRLNHISLDDLPTDLSSELHRLKSSLGSNYPQVLDLDEFCHSSERHSMGSFNWAQVEGRCKIIQVLDRSLRLAVEVTGEELMRYKHYYQNKHLIESRTCIFPEHEKLLLVLEAVPFGVSFSSVYQASLYLPPRKKAQLSSSADETSEYYTFYITSHSVKYLPEVLLFEESSGKMLIMEAR